MIDTKKIRERSRTLIDRSGHAVDDIMDLCDEVDRLRDRNDQFQAMNDNQFKQLTKLRPQVTQLSLAVGLVTTVVDGIEIDLDDPISMIQQVMDKVKQLQKQTNGEPDRIWAVEKVTREQQEGYRKEIQQLKEELQPPTHVGKIIDEQEKEIAELKAKFDSTKICADHNFDVQEKEIAELKSELEWFWDGSGHKACRKLTEAIEDVLDKEYYRSPATVTLQEALRKYGMK